ncbi:hypothetical protein JQ614_32195 [Bradyrhizobium diazoefficiens]|uniref:formate hydrogenlyase maturation HycH family protein n=1 Tax=Bradyrhizobium diazoefficiens TaxID=1355477 RepID=UPI001B8BCF6C|nr:formate hydrogenlyase maturation HycH family protein [Bradyrhizobium diazoefficiens]MBR0866291.1 hypothetical protein [Bradyrhizobium diazoefficiens]MBR0890752.1 hypothetical protein [Bradyrhizobium diazoefficiens]MBR0922585.1 hypothetical protein [Bradyrhizobium diazoefficiens]
MPSPPKRSCRPHEAPPPDAEQVLYYSLGIGHHVGVIDTFKPILDCAYDSYMAAVRSSDLQSPASPSPNVLVRRFAG